MAQILKGDTFANGQQVDGARLNQLVDSATILVGAITEQTAMAANTVEAADETIISDSGVLKKVQIGSILQSNLPIKTSSVSSNTGQDLVLTPASGQKVDVAGSFESDTNNTTGNSTVGGNLSVTGISTFNGNATANGNLTVNGSFTYGGNTPQKNVGIAVLSRRLTRGNQQWFTPAYSWVDLPYNTITEINPFVVNSATFTGVLSSAGSSVVTLPVGTYLFEAEFSLQSGGGGADIVTRVLNNTSGSTIAFGRQTTLNNYTNSRSVLTAIFTLTVQTDIKVQGWTTAVAWTNNLISAMGVPAPSEEVVFTAKIMKFV